MSLRARFLERLEIGVGLTGRAGPERAAYALHLGGPDEEPEVAIAMASYRSADGRTFSSTCGLEMRACLRDAGFVDPKRISGRYRPRMGLVMSDLEAIAIEHGAKVVPSVGAGIVPKAGDIVAVAWGDPAHAHVYGITKVVLVGADTIHLESVDGGQIDAARNQWTVRKARVWRRTVSGWMDTSVAIEPKGVTLDGGAARPVSFWIDLDRLDVATGKTDPAPPPVAAPRPPLPATSKALGAAAMVRDAIDRISSAPELTGIDVSSVQGVIDWARVAKARARGNAPKQPEPRDLSISFVYQRANQGRGDFDRNMDRNVAGARAVGLPVGLYAVLYPRPGGPQDAHLQADDLADACDRLHVDLDPAIDVEDVTRNKLPVIASEAEWAESVQLFGTRLEQRGYAPVLYLGPGFAQRFPAIVALPEIKRWAHWIPSYTDTPPHPHVDGTLVTMWQRLGSYPSYTGHADGIDGAVDVNTLFAPISALRRSAKILTR